MHGPINYAYFHKCFVVLAMQESRPASIPPNAGQTPAPPQGSPMPDSKLGSHAGSRAGSQAGSRPGSATLNNTENLSEIEVIGRDDNTRPALLPEPSPDEVRV